MGLEQSMVMALRDAVISFLLKFSTGVIYVPKED